MTYDGDRMSPGPRRLPTAERLVRILWGMGGGPVMSVLVRGMRSCFLDAAFAKRVGKTFGTPLLVSVFVFASLSDTSVPTLQIDALAATACK